MDHQGYFRIGYLTKTRGLKGELQLFFDFDDPDSLDLDSIYIEIDRQLVPFFVTSYRLQTNQMGYFFFEEIDYIVQAQDIVHKNVFLPDSIKPIRTEDDFYIYDLKGFEVREASLGRLRVIDEIDEYLRQYIATVL